MRFARLGDFVTVRYNHPFSNLLSQSSSKLASRLDSVLTLASRFYQTCTLGQSNFSAISSDEEPKNFLSKREALRLQIVK